MFERDHDNEVARLREAIGSADAIVVGAGAGLSAAAGLTYAGERFERLFADFVAKYRFRDMYSAGFYPFASREEHWAYWSRHIWCNRYVKPPKDTYGKLLRLLDGKNFFVITTNVDHQFQLAGFPKQRLFYTQGDYGLWQCCEPCHPETYDNYQFVRRMIEAQGFHIGDDGTLKVPEGALSMTVPRELVPRCHVCGKPLVMNLRVDGTFVEDRGWHEAGRRYQRFIDEHRRDKVLYLELGVGGNTPGIIKYPFWRATHSNAHATYACINLGESYTPADIRKRSILLDEDINHALAELLDTIEMEP